MTLKLLQIIKIDFFRSLLFIGLASMLCFTSGNNNENENPIKLKIVFKEMGSDSKHTDITEKNIKYIDGKNTFRTETYFWELAAIIYNRTDLNEVQSTGGKYCTLFGNLDNTIIENFDTYFFANYLTHEELHAQVQWQKSLQITDLASYQEYYSKLNPDVLSALSFRKEFTLEKQYEKVTALFNFYQEAYDNGSWVLSHNYR